MYCVIRRINVQISPRFFVERRGLVGKELELSYYFQKRRLFIIIIIIIMYFCTFVNSTFLVVYLIHVVTSNYLLTHLFVPNYAADQRSSGRNLANVPLVLPEKESEERKAALRRYLYQCTLLISTESTVFTVVRKTLRVSVESFRKKSETLRYFLPKRVI